MNWFRFVVGPRISSAEWAARRGRYLLPTLLLVVVAVLLATSVLLPYWKMTLFAPQYPKGLQMTAHLNRLSGDVAEIDLLNHYIGMRPLNEAAQFERSVSFMAIGVFAALALAAIRIRSPFAALFTLPAILFPGAFLLDLYLWMAHFGKNLDPHAPLSGAIKPFVPPILGHGKIAQFETMAEPGAGLIIATVAAVIAMVALYFHRAAFKPLSDAQKGPTESAT